VSIQYTRYALYNIYVDIIGFEKIACLITVPIKYAPSEALSTLLLVALLPVAYVPMIYKPCLYLV
jgi:hypothetical protein